MTNMLTLDGIMHAVRAMKHVPLHHPAVWLSAGDVAGMKVRGVTKDDLRKAARQEGFDVRFPRKVW